jgi:hypothetical protein
VADVATRHLIEPDLEDELVRQLHVRLVALLAPVPTARRAIGRTTGEARAAGVRPDVQPEFRVNNPARRALRR